MFRNQNMFFEYSNWLTQTIDEHKFSSWAFKQELVWHQSNYPGADPIDADHQYS